MRDINEGYKQIPSILMLGQPGTGKTTALMQFPSIGVIDLDLNLSGPLRWLNENNKNPSVYYDSPVVDEFNNKIPREDQFRKFAQIANEFIADDKIKVIGVDSLTTLVDVVCVEILRAQKKHIGNFDFKTVTSKSFDAAFEWSEWGAFFNIMKQMLFNLKASGKPIVFTGHLRAKEASLDKVMQNFIAVPGQTAEIIAGLFSEVWLFDNELSGFGANAKETRVVSTFPTAAANKTLGLKSSVGGKKTEDAMELVNLVMKSA